MYPLARRQRSSEISDKIIGAYGGVNACFSERRIEKSAQWSLLSKGNCRLSAMITGMQPAAIASYNRFEEAVSPEGRDAMLSASVRALPHVVDGAQ